MKIKVNKDACIGCGACAQIADQVFELDDEGLSQIKNDNTNDFVKIEEKHQEDVKNAVDTCPTGAIEIEE